MSQQQSTTSALFPADFMSACVRQHTAETHTQTHPGWKHWFYLLMIPCWESHLDFSVSALTWDLNMKSEFLAEQLVHLLAGCFSAGCLLTNWPSSLLSDKAAATAACCEAEYQSANLSCRPDHCTQAPHPQPGCDSGGRAVGLWLSNKPSDLTLNKKIIKKSGWESCTILGLWFWKALINQCSHTGVFIQSSLYF